MTEQIRAGAVAVNGWLAKILPSLVVAAIIGGFSAWVDLQRSDTRQQEQSSALAERVSKLEQRDQADRDIVARVAVLESSAKRMERMMETMLFELRQSRREVTP